MRLSELQNLDPVKTVIDGRICLVVVVPLEVTDQEAERAYDCLHDDERVRSERFATTELRRRFSVCRGRLRMLLSTMLDTSASTIKFEYSSLGKPYLRESSDLYFNVSHSQEWALIAFSKDSPVGVDIEFYDRRLNDQAIASQLLSESEFAQWSGLSEANQRHALLSIWVGKEAILKSLGLGITTSLKKLSLPIPIPREGFSPSIDAELIAKAESIVASSSTQHRVTSDRHLRFISEIPNAIAAVCFASGIESLRISHWHEIAHT